MTKHQESKAGALYVVATPIGNLADFSQRAIATLKSVDRVLAEDTRHTQILLQHYGIQVPLEALHRFNEAERCEKIASMLQQGRSLALVSDAGTPTISDPGTRIINHLIEHECKVIPIPGASAVITALSVSGLDGDQFVFEGFLPAKQSARIKRLTTLSTETRTLIFFEAPHRIVTTLQDLLEVFGPVRRGVLAKELTKKFEAIHYGTLKELNDWLGVDSNRQKGEFVIVLQKTNGESEQQIKLNAKQILEPLLNALPLKQAVVLAAKISGLSRNNLYSAALDLNKE